VRCRGPPGSCVAWCPGRAPSLAMVLNGDIAKMAARAFREAEAAMDRAGETVRVVTFQMQGKDAPEKPALDDEDRARVQRDVLSLENAIGALDSLSPHPRRKETIDGINALLSILDDILDGKKRSLALGAIGTRESYLPPDRESTYPLFDTFRDGPSR